MALLHELVYRKPRRVLAPSTQLRKSTLDAPLEGWTSEQRQRSFQSTKERHIEDFLNHVITALSRS
jgi:hypothetical protein